MPIDVLKVDRSIVRAVNERNGAAVFAGVIAIATSLDRRVAGAAVDPPTPAPAPGRRGGPSAQGYLYGRPTDASTAGRRLTTTPSSR